jgi:hypothetical protein
VCLFCLSSCVILCYDLPSLLKPVCSSLLYFVMLHRKEKSRGAQGAQLCCCLLAVAALIAALLGVTGRCRPKEEPQCVVLAVILACSLFLAAESYPPWTVLNENQTILEGELKDRILKLTAVSVALSSSPQHHALNLAIAVPG